MRTRDAVRSSFVRPLGSTGLHLEKIEPSLSHFFSRAALELSCRPAAAHRCLPAQPFILQSCAESSSWDCSATIVGQGQETVPQGLPDQRRDASYGIQIRHCWLARQARSQSRGEMAV